MVCNDCPASLLPNGRVLFAAAEYRNNDWGQPIYFFEYDPVTNTIAQVPTPVNNNMQLYWSRLMLLPTGEVLFSPSTNNIELYEPDGYPQEAWRPTIASITPHGFFIHDYYILQGTQLNGLSQANMYGDDCNPATNYPIVRLRNTATGHVYFGRTSTFSTRGIHAGSLQSCHFTLHGVPDGSYHVTVIANGIASHVMEFAKTSFIKPIIIDVGVKKEFEFINKEIYEGDPWDKRQWIVDPQIQEVQKEIRTLKTQVQQLVSLIETRELPHVGKEIAIGATATATTIAAGGALENGRQKKAKRERAETEA